MENSRIRDTLENSLQGTDEWRADRLGKITASKISDITAKTKNGYSATRKNYLAELLVERMTGQWTEGFVNSYMEWGTEHEPLALEAYEAEQMVEVTQVGFIQHPEIDNSGASPDGLIADDGMVEVKCPKTATHIDTILTRKIPQKYKYQMQWGMACTGRKWCDFVSYDPRLPENLQLVIIRVERDDKLISELTGEVKKADAEISEMIDNLNEATKIGE